jgi:hypothetical protein
MKNRLEAGRDEPLRADGPPASEEVLRLLHASPDRWSPGITATLHQWHDIGAMLARIPEGARRAGFGGLGVLIDAAAASVVTRQAAKEARSAVRSLLGVIRGQDTR